ncbi:MAG: hypothetical protein ACTSPH_13405 [Promethearchaeota archaeon]
MKSYNIPDEWSQKFHDTILFYKKLKIYKNIRILNKIELSLIVSEKGAIIFLSKDDEIDYNYCLIDNDKSFINLAIELLEWYWEKGNDLRPFVRKEILSSF